MKYWQRLLLATLAALGLHALFFIVFTKKPLPLPVQKGGGRGLVQLSDGRTAPTAPRPKPTQARSAVPPVPKPEPSAAPTDSEDGAGGEAFIGRAVDVCLRYEALLARCMNRKTDFAHQPSLIPQSREDYERVRHLCQENLDRMQSICR